MVMTHGWPGSIVEFHKVIGPLRDPPLAAMRRTRFTWSPRPCPGFGFSGKPTTPGWGVPRIADAWAR